MVSLPPTPTLPVGLLDDVVPTNLIDLEAHAGGVDTAETSTEADYVAT